MRAFQPDSLHPHQEPRHGFGEYEPAGRTAHASEAGQVHQVDTVTLRKGRHVPGPPAGGAGDPVYQHDRLSFASRLVADRPALYVDGPALEALSCSLVAPSEGTVRTVFFPAGSFEQHDDLFVRGLLEVLVPEADGVEVRGGFECNQGVYFR